MAKKATTAKTTKAAPETVKVAKSEPKEKKELKLDHLKRYNFESNGTAPTMSVNGKIYIVGGQVAELLVNSGFGKILE